MKKIITIFLLSVVLILQPIEILGILGAISNRVDSGGTRRGRSSMQPQSAARGNPTMSRPGSMAGTRLGQGMAGNRPNPLQAKSRDRMNAQRNFLQRPYKGRSWNWWRMNNPAFFSGYFATNFYDAYGYYPPLYYDNGGYTNGYTENQFTGGDSLNPPPYDGRNRTDECVQNCMRLTSLSNRECLAECAQQ